MSNLLEQASLVLIPSGYKEDVVYSEIPIDGSGDMTLTRASNGTRINSAGLVEVCPWNLLQYSNAFNTAPWAMNVTSGQAGKDGQNNAWLLTKSGATTSDYYNSNVYNGDQTFTIYVKKESGKGFKLFPIGTTTTNVEVNLQTGVVLNQGAGITSTTVEAYSSTWWKISVALNMINSNYYIYVTDGAGTQIASSITIQDAQVNIGFTAKPYFPTTDRLNVPRLTYQNGGGGCPSLLLEKQSTNGLYPSEDFSTTWNLFNSATVTTNQATSPDGTQNADKLTTTNQATAIYNVNGAGTSAQAYTASLFIKYIDNTEFAIGMTDDVTGEAFARFNFTTGTATTTLQGDWTSITYAWEQQANGWYRISVTATKGASGNARFIGKGGGAYNYYIWGAQVEAGSYKTSYIPTTSSTATRVADACFKTGISSLIGQTEGVIFWDINFVADGTEQTINISDGTNFIYLQKYTDNKFYTGVYNGSFVGSITSSVLTSGRKKIAFGYILNSLVLYINGVLIGTDLTSTIPTCDRLSLTVSNTGSIETNNFILFPTKLTNAELASLTTL